MLFSPNQTEFTNDYQHKVWQLGIRIVPLEVSLANISDSEMKEGCKQIYRFTMELLTDQYKNWTDYAPIDPWVYLYRCFDWFSFGNENGVTDFKDLHWSLSGEISKKLIDQYFLIFHKMEKFGFKISGGNELKKGRKKGYVILDVDDKYVLKNERYPLFLKYWYLLRQHAEKRKVYYSNYVFLCDFRIFVKPYKRTIDDLLRGLSDMYQGYFHELHKYALLKGAKLESHIYYGRFRYVYKNSYVLILDNNPPLISVPFRLNKMEDILSEFTLFLEEAEKQPDNDELVAYIQKNICVCTSCQGRGEGRKSQTERCGRWVEIRGARRLIAMCCKSISKRHCGKRLRFYTDKDITMLKRIIDIRFSQIDTFYA